MANYIKYGMSKILKNNDVVNVNDLIKQLVIIASDCKRNEIPYELYMDFITYISNLRFSNPKNLLVMWRKFKNTSHS